MEFKNRTKQATTNLAEVHRNNMKHTLQKIAIDLLAIKELNKIQMQILNSTYDE